MKSDDGDDHKNLHSWPSIMDDPQRERQTVRKKSGCTVAQDRYTSLKAELYTHFSNGSAGVSGIHLKECTPSDFVMDD